MATVGSSNAFNYIHIFIYEGLRTRVDQPKIKDWKLHELCKNAIKNVHTIRACGQKFQIPKCSAASEMHFKSIPMLGGANSTFVG